MAPQTCLRGWALGGLAALQMLGMPGLWALDGGETIKASVVLDKDISTFAFYGLTVGADNITIDGNGHALIGLRPLGTWVTQGICLSGRKNVVIKNFSRISGFDYGLYNWSSENTLVENCQFKGNVQAGIYDCGNGLTVRNCAFRETHTAIHLPSSANVKIVNNTLTGGRSGARALNGGAIVTFTGNRLDHQVQNLLQDNRSLFRFTSVRRSGAVGESFGFSLDMRLIGGSSAPASTCAIRTVPPTAVQWGQSGNTVTGSFVASRPGLHALVAEVTDPQGNRETRLARIYVGPTASRSEVYYWTAKKPIHGQAPRDGYDTGGLYPALPAVQSSVNCGGWVQESPDQLPQAPAALLTSVDFNLLFRFGPSFQGGPRLRLQRDVTYGVDGEKSVGIPPALGTGNYVWGRYGIGDLNWTLDYPIEWYFLGMKFLVDAGNPEVQTGNPAQPSQSRISYRVTASPEIQSISSHEILVLSATSNSGTLAGEEITVRGEGGQADLALAGLRRPFREVETRIDSVAQALFATGSIAGERTFVTVPLEIWPAAAAVRIRVTAWPASGEGIREWSEAPEGVPGQIRHTLGGLVPLASYRITAGGAPWALSTADAQGRLSFDYSGALPVTLALLPVAANQPPVAGSQGVTTAEDTAQAIILSATDSNGDALTYAVASVPAHGTLSGSAPNLTYLPAVNYNGPDSFTFKANDGKADSNVATVSITVTQVNDAPTLISSPTAAPNPAWTGQAVGFSAAAADADGDLLTFGWNFGDGTGGTGPAPSHSFAAPGSYTVTVTASDGRGGSALGSVVVAVTQADTAGPALNTASAVLKGTVSDSSGVGSLKVNGLAVTVNADGTWQKEIPLTAATTTVTLTATDNAGNVTNKTVTLSK